MTFLLDTCVVSELVARQPDPGVVQWIDSMDEDKLFLSAITIGEIKEGIEKLRRLEPQERFGRMARGRPAHSLHETKSCPSTPRSCLSGEDSTADLEKQGTPMPAIDSLIAATALQGRLEPGHPQRGRLCPLRCCGDQSMGAHSCCFLLPTVLAENPIRSRLWPICLVLW